MPLRFLRLPELVQTEILLHLNPLDFFVFSLISRKTKVISVYCKFKIDRVTWRFHKQAWAFDEIYYFLTLKTSSGVWYLGIPFDYNMSTDQCGTLAFNGSNLPFHRFTKFLVVPPGNLTYFERIQLFEHLTTSIFDIFKISECHLNADSLKHTELVLNHTKSLKTLSIFDSEQSDRLSTLLENLEIEELRVNVRFPGNLTLQYEGPLTMEFLNCDDLFWIVEESLWNMECKKVHVKDLSHQMLEDFVQNWMAGMMSNLEEFTLDLEFERDVVIRVVENMATEQIDDDTFCFEREDGATATLAIKPPGFVFVVEKCCNKITL